jgi:MFS superfamily sulfate permease-like transporter
VKKVISWSHNLLPNSTCTDRYSEKLHEILESFFEKVRAAHPLTVVVAFSSIAALLLARQAKRRFAKLKRLPEALFLVVFWILVSHFADFEGKGVKVIGEVPSGFPSPENILWWGCVQAEFSGPVA